MISLLCFRSVWPRLETSAGQERPCAPVPLRRRRRPRRKKSLTPDLNQTSSESLCQRLWPHVIFTFLSSPFSWPEDISCLLQLVLKHVPPLWSNPLLWAQDDICLLQLVFWYVPLFCQVHFRELKTSACSSYSSALACSSVLLSPFPWTQDDICPLQLVFWQAPPFLPVSMNWNMCLSNNQKGRVHKMAHNNVLQRLCVNAK